MKKHAATIGLIIVGLAHSGWAEEANSDTVQSRVGLYATKETADLLGIDSSSAPVVSSSMVAAMPQVSFFRVHNPFSGWFGGLGGLTRKIFHGGTDWFNSFKEETFEWVTSDLGSVTTSVGPLTIGISSYVKEAYGQQVVDKIKDTFSSRPEWFTDSPWWVDLMVEGSVGISIQSVNAGIDVGLAVKRGDFSLNNEMKAKILTAIVDEGVAYAKKSAMGALAESTGPAFAILIDPAVSYGFDRVQDKIDEKISQHFAPDGPGVAEVQDAESKNKPIETTLCGGVVIPSVLISNYIQLGNPADQKISIVSSPSKDRPSYYGAIGGEVKITGETIILGEVRMIAVSSIKNLPTDFLNYVNEITKKINDGMPAIDNKSPVASANG